MLAMTLAVTSRANKPQEVPTTALHRILGAPVASCEFVEGQVRFTRDASCHDSVLQRCATTRYQVVPKRWMVERTVSWFGRQRRLIDALLGEIREAARRTRVAPRDVTPKGLPRPQQTVTAAPGERALRRAWDWERSAPRPRRGRPYPRGTN